MFFLLAYLTILLAVFLLQRQLMYFPERFNAAQQQKLLTLLKLQAWPSAADARGFIRPLPVAESKGTVLVFHGNAGAALHRTYYIDALQALGYRVILAEYPGYGTRPGSPSESALIEDAVESAKMAWQQFGEPLFLCGESLGSGVVAGVVASGVVPVKGILLITPFDSMAAVAQHHYWYFMAGWLVRDRYDNLAKLAAFSGNSTVLLAEQDMVVPNRNTEALFDALPAAKRLWRFKEAGHNSLPIEPWQAWWSEVMRFLDQ